MVSAFKQLMSCIRCVSARQTKRQKTQATLALWRYLSYRAYSVSLLHRLGLVTILVLATPVKQTQGVLLVLWLSLFKWTVGKDPFQHIETVAKCQCMHRGSTVLVYTRGGLDDKNITILKGISVTDKYVSWRAGAAFLF